MKKLLLIVTTFCSAIAFSQIVVTPTPRTINDVVTISYGADPVTGWSELDPQSEDPLYLYLGIDTNNSTTVWEYHDQWNNCDPSNLIKMFYNITTNKYEATVDFKTHNFDGAGGVLPVGTDVSNGYFIIRKGQTYECAPNPSNSATWQTADQNFSFTPAKVILASKEVKLNRKIAKVINGDLYVSKSGIFNVKVYDVSGKLLKSTNGQKLNTMEKFSLKMSQNGTYICVVEDENGNKQSVKFIK